jgi:hypothetical protein
MHLLCVCEGVKYDRIDLWFANNQRRESQVAPLTRVFDSSGQVTKSTWGMSWLQEALKGVEDCDKLGVFVKRKLIPRFPNRFVLPSWSFGYFVYYGLRHFSGQRRRLARKGHLSHRSSVRRHHSGLRGRARRDCLALCTKGRPLLEFQLTDSRLRPRARDCLPALGPANGSTPVLLGCRTGQ